MEDLATLPTPMSEAPLPRRASTPSFVAELKSHGCGLSPVVASCTSVASIMYVSPTAAGGLLVDPRRPTFCTDEPVAVDGGLGTESDDVAAN